MNIMTSSQALHRTFLLTSLDLSCVLNNLPNRIFKSLKQDNLIITLFFFKIPYIAPKLNGDR